MPCPFDIPCEYTPKQSFDGMTNGEVIEKMFPNADYEIGQQFAHITNVNTIGDIALPLDWWNAPYKGGKE